MLEAIRKAAERARTSGALHSIPTSYGIIEQPTTKIQFLVRVLASLRRKERAKVQAEDEAKKSGSSVRNPFLPFDPAMFVEYTSATHVCLLNKFNVVDDHVLLVTREFEDQSSLLTAADFSALWRCLSRFDALGFYNAGQVAGASQLHKHLQLVPTPIIPHSHHRVPFDRVLLHDRASTKTPYAVAELPFLHLAISMSDCNYHAMQENEPEKAGQLSMERYTTLLHQLSQETGLRVAQNANSVQTKLLEGRQPFPYNLLVTRDWMLMVPRSREEFEGISVNSLGFAGALLVRSEEDLEKIKSNPMHVLMSVGFPLD